MTEFIYLKSIRLLPRAGSFLPGPGPGRLPVILPGRVAWRLEAHTQKARQFDSPSPSQLAQGSTAAQSGSGPTTLPPAQAPRRCGSSGIATAAVEDTLAAK